MTCDNVSPEGNIWLNPKTSPKSCDLCDSNPHAVVARLTNLPDPLVNLVVALLPDLEILHPQSTGTEHRYLNSHRFRETSCKCGSALHACPAVSCSCDADGNRVQGSCAMEALQTELHNYSQTEHVISLESHANG